LYYRVWIRIDRPNHVILNFLYHGELALPKNLKYIYILHSPSTLIQNRYNFIKNNKNKFENLTFIAVSDFVMENALFYVEDRPLKLIHHGIDTNRITHKQNYKSEKVIKLVTASALEEWKGVQEIIYAICHPTLFGSFTLDIYGRGTFENQLIKIISENNAGSIIKINGWINNIEEVYCNYDIYCQMSQGEAFGLSLFEAMASGLPSIVFDSPPFDKLIPSDCILKINPLLANQLVDALKLLSTEKERKNLGEKARNFVKEYYSTAKMVNNYMDLICDQ